MSDAPERRDLRLDEDRRGGASNDRAAETLLRGLVWRDRRIAHLEHELAAAQRRIAQLTRKAPE